MTPPQNTPDKIPPTDSAWAWDLYWHTNTLHSCVPTSNPAAAQALTDHWADFFSTLPKDATIVDLGTGNGAVISIAAEVDRNRNGRFSLHGVDAADIDPVTYVKAAPRTLSHVTFHPRTRMEALPFPENSVTAVCGQYALEYSMVEKTIAEIVRILAPGGRFQFLVHAHDSVLISRSRTQLAQAKAILNSDLADMFRTALPLIIEAESATAGNALAFQKAKNAFDAFNHSFSRLQTHFQNDEDQSIPANFLEALSQLYQSRKRFSSDSILSMFDNMCMHLQAQAQRLHDLIEAALDDDGINALIEKLSRQGAHVMPGQKAHSGKSNVLLGWWIAGHIGN